MGDSLNKKRILSISSYLIRSREIKLSCKDGNWPASVFSMMMMMVWFRRERAVNAFGGFWAVFWAGLVHSRSCAEHLTVESYSITHSLFHSGLKIFLFCKSFPPQPFLFFFRIPPDFCCYFWPYPFYFLVSVLHFLVVVSDFPCGRLNWLMSVFVL